MPKRKFAPREASGKVQRARVGDRRQPQPTSAGEIRRLVESSLAGMRDPLFGSMLGRLLLAEKISPGEAAAGKRWGELASRYSASRLSPQAPRSVRYDADVGGRAPDPDSDAGLIDAKKDRRAAEDFREASHALHSLGNGSFKAIAAIVERGEAPTGHDQLQSLRTGLQTLATLWRNDKRKASVRA
jgi:hypothetical protein